MECLSHSIVWHLFDEILLLKQSRMDNKPSYIPIYIILENLCRSNTGRHAPFRGVCIHVWIFNLYTGCVTNARNTQLRLGLRLAVSVFLQQL